MSISQLLVLSALSPLAFAAHPPTCREPFDSYVGFIQVATRLKAKNNAQGSVAAFESMSHDSGSSNKQVQVMGLFGTGTNYVAELIGSNWAKVFEVTGGNDGKVGPGCRFWKHSWLTALAEYSGSQDTWPHFETDCGAKNQSGVAMVRNPISWLAALRDDPWDLSLCTTGDDWLTRNCSFDDAERTEYDAKSVLDGRTFSSVVDIWNLWTRDFMNLTAFGFRSDAAIAIRYEDLVLQPELKLERFAEATGVPKLEEWQIVNETVSPTLNWWRRLFGLDHSDNELELATEKIVTKSYLSAFTAEELQHICEQVDMDLMRLLSYDDCDNITAIALS